MRKWKTSLTIQREEAKKYLLYNGIQFALKTKVAESRKELIQFMRKKMIFQINLNTGKIRGMVNISFKNWHSDRIVVEFCYKIKVDA